MIDLNNLDQIKQLDPKDVFGSTGMLASQCNQIWQDAKSIQFPQDYKQIENIVICGMGGSAYGGHVLKTLYKELLNVPVYINSDYTLPGFVNEKTLVILTSYSGSTEETLANGKEALERKAKITGLTSGGKLGEFLKKNSFPALVFNPQFNPSTQPRLGTGYIVLGTIALLKQHSVLTISDGDAQAAITELTNNAGSIKTKAQEIAQKIQGFIPVIFAASFLEGNAHIMRNQFNETSKSFSAFSELPELNHHLMEGFKNPADKKLIVLVINSSQYMSILQKRISLTQTVIEKNNVSSVIYDAQGSSKLSQVLNVLSFGGYLTVYLAFVYGLDPSLIPWVDFFKQELAK